MSTGQVPWAQGTDDWRRMHPLSPLARGWIAFVVVIGAWLNTVFNGFLEDLTGTAENSPSPEDVPQVTEFFVTLPAWLLYTGFGLAGALLAAAGGAYVWWFTRYQITPTHVRLRSGLVFRQDRQTRLDRVQALDIQRPLVPRLLGLAELRFEVADAGETSVALRYLKHDDARDLRRQLLGATEPQVGSSPAADSEPVDGLVEATEQGDRTDEVEILSVPIGRALAARVLSIPFILLVLVLAVAGLVSLFNPHAIGGILAGAVPAVLPLAGSVLQALEVSWGFRMYRTTDGLRLRYGLLNKTSQTVPSGRVQAMAVHRAPLWRPFSWSLVKVNVAGYGTETGNESAGNRSVLLPVGTDAQLDLLFREGLDLPADLTAFVIEGLVGEAKDGSPFSSAPHRAVWASPVVRRRHGYAVTPRALLSRTGRLHRTCHVVPHDKVQSIGLGRGPVLWRLNLATVSLHSISGAVQPTIECMDVAEAQQFISDQLRRGRPTPSAIPQPTSSPTRPTSPTRPAGAHR